MPRNSVDIYAYFLNRLRDNLHVVLSFSHLRPDFPLRAQMFPAVFSSVPRQAPAASCRPAADISDYAIRAVNINWFLPWPEEALVSVSANFLKNFKIDTTEEHRNRLYEVMGSFQLRVRHMCGVYLSRMRKHVSFLCFIEYYKKLYELKHEEVNVQEKSVIIGLRKLDEAAKNVVQMQEAQEEILRKEDDKTNKLLVKVQGEKARAEKKAEEANRQLQEALPYLHEERRVLCPPLEQQGNSSFQANAACNSIKDKDIVELKGNKSPVDIVRYTFDGLLLLLGLKVVEVRQEDRMINKVTGTFIKDSFDEHAKSMLADINFLKILGFKSADFS
eukprot:s9039_g1.t1